MLYQVISKATTYYTVLHPVIESSQQQKLTSKLRNSRTCSWYYSIIQCQLMNILRNFLYALLKNAG